MPIAQRFVLVVAAGVLAACASGGAKAAREEDCAPRAQDSLFTRFAPAWRDCAVDTKAKLTSTDVRPDFRPAPTRTTCYAADFEFVVDTTGAVEVATARMTRATDSEFAASVSSMLSRLRFDPARKDGRPVRQIFFLHQMTAVQILRVAVPAGAGAPPRPSRGTMPRPPTC